MVDRERRARVARGEADGAAGQRFHREHGRAHLVALLSGAIEAGKEEQVAHAGGAGAAGDGDGDLRHEQRARALELRSLSLQPIGALEAQAHADVISEAFADGQAAHRADAATQKDSGRPVRAGGDDDSPRA